MTMDKRHGPFRRMRRAQPIMGGTLGMGGGPRWLQAIRLYVTGVRFPNTTRAVMRSGPRKKYNATTGRWEWR